MRKAATNFGRLLYGGDYNPEQWVSRPDILEKDIDYMKQAHINTVSLGIFSWAMLEPEEGRYDFSWLEERIDTLYKNGISVILATPSGGKPRWMAEKYPEIMRTNARREKELYGVRHNHCYTSPVYREKVRSINQELAKRFDKHPGVLAWHISNEYGGECHCPLCQRAFQEWLKERYGTVGKLNEAWYTTFWSHNYQRFEQVESPSPLGETSLHGLNLDWKRFVTDRTVDFVREEIRAIREAGGKKPATINMMYYYDGLNYHKFADVVDFVSWDNYPTWHKGDDAKTAMDGAMYHDLMRSIKHEPFLLMESCPTATNWQSVSKLKKPGLLKAASLQAVAHGSDSVLYFQIRQSRGSYEKFHGAVIDHYGGTDTRVFSEVTDTGKSLTRLESVVGSEVKARAAVIYDWENRWAMEDAAGPRNKNLYYKENVEKSYHALRKYGLNVDVIDMEQELDAYEVLAAPMVYLFRDGFEEKVRRFVEKGGTLLMTYLSGVVDETDLCHLEGTPHGLLDVLGLRTEEIDGLYDWEENRAVPVEENTLGLEKTYRCKHLCELVRPNGAEVLAVYGEDFYRGKPVLTRNVYGEGTAWYIAADLEQDFYDEVYERVLKERDIKPLLSGVRLPEGVSISSREDEKAVYYFLQNFTRQTVSLSIPEDLKVLEGDGKDTLHAFGTLVLEKKKS